MIILPAFTTVFAHIDSLWWVAVGAILTLFSEVPLEAITLVGLIVLGRDAVAKERAWVHGACVLAHGCRLVHYLVGDVEPEHIQKKVTNAEVNVSNLSDLNVNRKYLKFSCW